LHKTEADETHHRAVDERQNRRLRIAKIAVGQGTLGHVSRRQPVKTLVYVQTTEQNMEGGAGQVDGQHDGQAYCQPEARLRRLGRPRGGGGSLVSGIALHISHGALSNGELPSNFVVQGRGHPDRREFAALLGLGEFLGVAVWLLTCYTTCHVKGGSS